MSGRSIAVIGGGLTGLSAAHRLIELGGNDVSVTVFEASARAGGVIETVTDGDWLIERGTDSFITNKPWAVDLCQRIGLESQLISTNSQHRRSLVLRNGKPTPVPAGFQLLMPTRVEPLLESTILSAAGKQRVLAERSIPPTTSKEDESLAAFVRRRFGDELFDRLAQPMVGGIYTADPDRLSLRATLVRFAEMEQKHGSLLAAAEAETQQAASGARYGLFAGIEGGMSTLIHALASRIEQSHTIKFGHPARSLVKSTGSSWTLNGTEHFDAVLTTLPAWRAADFLSGASLELAKELADIEYASSAVVCTKHAIADFSFGMDAFGLVIPAIEGRRVLAVSFASRKFANRAPNGHIVLRTFVGGAMQPEVLVNNDERLVEIVTAELREIFGLQTNPLGSLVTRYDRAMPQYHVGHLDRVERIEDLTAEMDRFEIAGNAYRGVGVPDCVHAGEQAAERLLGGL